MSQDTNALPTDFELEEYVIESILGTGGFGITYKARDKLLDTLVAVKEYFPVEWSYRTHDGVSVGSNALGSAIIPEVQSSGYEWGLTRFLDEARVLAKVQHPYVVRIKRYFRAHGTAYIVMDYEEGEPLSALLKRETTLPETDLRGMLDEVLPALEAVHKEGYLHRDIKPSNLYIRARDGAVMLIDFGAARQSLSRRSKSVTGLVTPGYSPPEQYVTRSDRYGPWTDIYALGAVLYRCISGKAPTEAPDRQMWDTLPPAVEAGAGRYSPGFLSMVDRALAMRPEDRYQTIGDMLSALKVSAPLDVEKVPSRFSRPHGFSRPTEKPQDDPISPSYFRNLYRSSKSSRSRPPDQMAPVTQLPTRKSQMPRPTDEVTGQAEFEPLLPVLRSRTHFNKEAISKLPDSIGEPAVKIKPRLPGSVNLSKPVEPVEPVEPAMPEESILPVRPKSGPRLPRVTPSLSPEEEPHAAESVTPHSDSDEPLPDEPLLLEKPQTELPLPRRKSIRSSTWRLGVLLTLLLAALGWAVATVYLDYREREANRLEAQRRQEEENARHAAAEYERRKQQEAKRVQAENYLEQVREALKNKDLNKAEDYLKQAESLYPASPRLAEVRAELTATQQTIASLKTEVEPRINMPLVWIKEGCFQMGSSPELTERFANETPQHQVCVKSFWISQYEVNNAQYRLFKPDHNSGRYANLTLNDDRQPVADVNWQEAMAYADWLSRQTGKHYRLPTEAEWEYAARAETGYGRYWSDKSADACRYANVADQAARQTWESAAAIHECDDKQAVAAPVGAFQPNAWNLYDMLGNVAEWTCSDYASYDKQSGEEKRCSARDRASGTRTVRGGSWKDEPRMVRAANRDEKSVDIRDYGLGFRLVREE